MSGTGSATMPSSASASSMLATCVSSGVTTSTRAPAMRRRRSAEISATGVARLLPLICSSSPSRAANTSSTPRQSFTRIFASVSSCSITTSSWPGS